MYLRAVQGNRVHSFLLKNFEVILKVSRKIFQFQEIQLDSKSYKK